MLPSLQEPIQGFPILDCLRPLTEREWAHPIKDRASHKPNTKLFNLTKEDKQLLKLPLVDAPVAVLGSPSVLPTVSKGVPKDSMDKIIELAARKAFNASSGALRALVEATLASGVLILWLQHFSEQHKLSSEAWADLHKMALADAYAADVTANTLQPRQVHSVSSRGAQTHLAL